MEGETRPNMVNVYKELEEIEVGKGEIKELQDDILDLFHSKEKKEKLIKLMNELQELEKELEELEEEFKQYQ